MPGILNWKNSAMLVLEPVPMRTASLLWKERVDLQATLPAKTSAQQCRLAEGN
jgi:hypothetical protein